MPYTSLADIERKKALSQQLRNKRIPHDPRGQFSWTQGIADILNKRNAAVLGDQAVEAAAANDALKQKEMQQLLADTLRGGKNVVPYAPGMQYTHPDVQNLAASNQMNLGLARARAGMFNRTPANIQEWNAYSQMSDEEKAAYLRMKRADKVINLGDRQVIPGMIDPSQTAASFDVNLKPGEQPTNIQKQEEAKVIGEVEGMYETAEKRGEAEAKVGQMEATGRETGQANVEQHASAESALSSMSKIDDLIEHIDSSDALTGLGAETFKNIERVKAMFGGDPSKVKDTELLDVMMGSEVFPMIKNLGIGARGMDTPAERQFMRQVLTGEISLNKETLKEMALIRRNVAQRVVDRWNKRIDDGELENYFTASGRKKQKLFVGADSSRSSSTRVKNMSDDELFQ